MARWLMAAAGAAAGSGQAFAGAWVQTPGHSQQITDISRERGDFGETWRTDVYGEYGLAKNWGGTLKLDTQIREDQN